MTLEGIVFSCVKGKSQKTGRDFTTLSVIDQGDKPRYPRSVEVSVVGEVNGTEFEGKRVVVNVVRIDKNFDGSVRVGGEVKVVE